MKKLLLICTGNTCRSPMAGALAIAWLKNKGEAQIEVKTAGLAVYGNSPAAEQGITVMKERGLDLSAHQSTQLTEELTDWADLILTMTWSHKQQLLSVFPQAIDKTYTLGEYSVQPAASREIKEILKKIQAKEKDFLLTHGDKLDKLLAEKEALLQELDRVEEELNEWQKLFQKKTNEERQKLLTLEREIRALDISDPFGGSVEDYRQTAQVLEKLLPDALTRFYQKGRE